MTGMPSSVVSRPIASQLIGAGGGKITIEAKNSADLVERIEDAAAQNRSDLVKAILERGDNPEVPATTAHAPVQILVFAVVGGEQATVGGHDIHRNHIVAGEAVLADQPAHAAAKRQAGNAGRRDHAHRGGETEGLGFTIELAMVRPGSARTVRLAGSTRMPFMAERSIIRPSSQIALPAML